MSNPGTKKGWSKSQIVKLCGVSDGLVGKMHKVRALYKRNDDLGRQFRDKLGMRLEEVRWRSAHMTWLDVEPRVYDIEAKAGKLARFLKSRAGTKLSDDPEVTARALAIYDEQLVEPLAEALQRLAAEADEDYESLEIRPGESRGEHAERVRASWIREANAQEQPEEF
jgi:hypothetical protein